MAECLIADWSARFSGFATSDALNPHVRWQSLILRRKWRREHPSGSFGDQFLRPFPGPARLTPCRPEASSQFTHGGVR
eukprot:13070405-Alexandrium_andersonii.AAC.1